MATFPIVGNNKAGTPLTGYLGITSAKHSFVTKKEKDFFQPDSTIKTFVHAEWHMSRDWRL